MTSKTTNLLLRPPVIDTSIDRLSWVFQRLHLDWLTTLLIVILCIIGLFTVYSASEQSSALVNKQIVNMLIALLIMFVCAQFDIRFIRYFAPWAYVVGIICLLLTSWVGIEVKGSQRWLGVAGVIAFQPSEFMKLIVPCTVTWFLTSQQLPPRLKEIFISLTIIIVPTILIGIQPDFGTAIIIASIGFITLFLAGLPYWFLISGFISFLALVPIAWNFLLLDYHKNRILVFLDPQRDPLGSGWNITQSITAIGSGGIEGKGWLKGTQSYLNFLPESHTDFVFSVIAEEQGIIGVVILLTVYTLLIFRGLHIASKAQETYSRLIAGTLVMSVFVYIFINIGMVSALLPVVGVPLPFISYGGTSIVTIMASFGILMSIRTHKRLLNR